MSQYGAYGAALSGLTRDEILEFYYPGTTRTTAIGNPTVRVRLTALGTSSTQVVTAPKLVITDGTRTGSLYAKNADGTLRTRWRVVADGTGLTLQWLEKGTWRSTSSWKAGSKPLSFSDTSLGKVRVVMPDGTQRDYRRTVRSVRSGSGVMSLSVVPMDYYLQGVVPSEMPSSWSSTALQVQAVAARTYAAYEMAHQPAGSAFDLCDSTSCQVYKGLAGYTSSGTPFRTRPPRRPRRSPRRRRSASDLTVRPRSHRVQRVERRPDRGVVAGLPGSRSDPYDESRRRRSTSVRTTRSPPSLQTRTRGRHLAGLRINERDGITWWGGRITSVTVMGLRLHDGHR